MLSNSNLNKREVSVENFKHIQAAGCLFSVPWSDLKDEYKEVYPASQSFKRFDGLDVVKAPYEAICNHEEAIFEQFNTQEHQEVLNQLFPSEYNYYLLYAPVFGSEGGDFIDLQSNTKLIPFDIDLNLDFVQYLDENRILEFDLSVEFEDSGSFYYIGLSDADYFLLEEMSYEEWTSWAVEQLNL